MNDSSQAQPWPVHRVNLALKGWVEQCGAVWMEGQLVQFNRRASLAYGVLRDIDQDVSLDLSFFASVLAGLDLQVGQRLIVNAKPQFWAKRGRLSFEVRQVKLAGLGELLARLEQLKRKLAAEGLFDAERKKPLPFAPAVVGLITGRQSDAEQDVIQVATSRWPGVRFVVKQVAVQGDSAAGQVTAALRELDEDPQVPVIIIARGGGAVEDLLPFSDETLVKAVAAASTPVVSAIGHQADSPILDLVADFRAATPTDAAKNVVPDAALERAGIVDLAARAQRNITRRLEAEQDRLNAILSRPVLATPGWIIDSRLGEVASLKNDAQRAFERQLTVQVAQVAALGAKLAALSPQGTLDRGYALVTLADGGLVTQPSQAPAGTGLTVRVAGGKFPARAGSGKAN